MVFDSCYWDICHKLFTTNPMPNKIQVYRCIEVTRLHKSLISTCYISIVTWFSFKCMIHKFWHALWIKVVLVEDHSEYIFSPWKLKLKTCPLIRIQVDGSQTQQISEVQHLQKYTTSHIIQSSFLPFFYFLSSW